MTDPAGAFWEYALVLYGRPGVSEALIRLQDTHGADVNVMLYCCWRAAAGGGALDAAGLAALDAAIAEWRSAAVLPLRALRRDLKATVPGVADADREALRAEVQRLEIEAERLAQRLLVEAAPPAAAESPDDPRASARRSLETYLSGLDAPADSQRQGRLDAILAAAFDPASKMPDSTPDEVTSPTGSG